MRVEDPEQGFGDFREIVVNFQVDAGGEKGEGLDQALDVRVGALIALQQLARGNLGVALGELRAHLAHEGQLIFVIA